MIFEKADGQWDHFEQVVPLTTDKNKENNNEQKRETNRSYPSQECIVKNNRVVTRALLQADTHIIVAFQRILMLGHTVEDGFNRGIEDIGISNKRFQ